MEKTIKQMIDEVKSRERVELRDAIINKGKRVDGGFEYHFEEECPIIAAYCGDEPADVVILSVRMDKEGNLTIKGEEKLDRMNKFEVDLDNIFAGQLEFVIGNIV